MCDWKGLRKQIAASKWLQSGDDLDSHRGLVTTSIAILERMRDGERLRLVSWTPERTLQRRATQTVSQPVMLPKPSQKPSNEDGGALVKPNPRPHMPRPGGAAVAVPEIIF